MQIRRFIYIFIFIYLWIALPVYGQYVQAHYRIDLSDTLSESSALLCIDSHLYSINDSGNAPIIYELDTVNAFIVRQIYVKGSENIDWEALAQNDNYIFIGDFGNNKGNRQNLGIYKIDKSDFLNTPNDTVEAEHISFSYQAQTTFEELNYSNNNLDAEALVAIGDSLYIFSKNWGNGKTYLYALSQALGTYSLIIKDSIDIQALVTDATYLPEHQKIVLIAINFSSLKLIDFDVNTDNVSFGDNVNIELLNLTDSKQVEGLCFKNNGFYATAEYFDSHNACLYSIDSLKATNISFIENTKNWVNCYPNPSSTGQITLQSDIDLRFSVINEQGVIVSEGRTFINRVLRLPSGFYIVKVWDDNFIPIQNIKLIIL